MTFVPEPSFSAFISTRQCPLTTSLRSYLIAVLLSLLIGAPARSQIYLGNYTGHTIAGKAITINAGSSSVRFMFYATDVLRLDFRPDPSIPTDSSFVVIRDTAEAVHFTVTTSDSTVEFASSALRIVCTKTPLRLSYYSSAGRLLLSEPASGGLAISPPFPSATFTLQPDDHFYGTGERGIGPDLRESSFDSYNTQIGGYRSPLSTMNINIPFLASTRGYALYFENTYQGRFNLGTTDPAKFTYSVSGGSLSYYLIAGETISRQLDRYTWLTGRQPLPPRWAFGFVQSRFGYRNETEARAMVQTMRQKQIPCDAIILDLYWFERMGDLSWRTSSWPNPDQMMTDFLAQGIKTIVITEPYVTQPSLNFSPGAAGGYLAKDNRGEPYILTNWWSCGCNASLVDMTNPAAQHWWWSLHLPFFGQHLAGIWTDLGEPERHPIDMLHALGSTARVHNVYNLLWAETIFEGFHQFRPNERLFNLTRSGYAGIQRYGVIPWSGDVGKDFGGLAVQIPMLLNMGMSGLAYHNSDIGGFCCGTTTPELYIRWMQYGTFCPIARAHGVGQDTEPWGFGEPAETISRSFIQLRYRLLPYIYTMARRNHETGLPLARPLFFEDANDPLLYNEGSSYLWGDDLLVSPVVRAAQLTKDVRLPRGTWIDYWTGEVYQGGQGITVQAPLEHMPIFVRAGSIIPMQPIMNYSDERQLDTLMLQLYPSTERRGEFSLYEDDGKTLEYQSGSFAETQFLQEITQSGNASTLRIAIGATRGSYSGKPSRRVYISEIHGIAGKPSFIRRDGISVSERATLVELRQNGDGFFFDSTSNTLYIHTPTVPDSAYELLVDRVVLGIDETNGNPTGYRLEQNHPNPFNPTTRIRFSIPQPGEARSQTLLQVYDIMGREVATLVNDSLPPGDYSVLFDAENSGLKNLSSGTYYYRLTAGGFTQTRKMVLLR